MDRVLRFLIIFTLVLICVVILLWMSGASCAVGYASTHQKTLPYIIKGVYDKLDDVSNDLKQEYGEIRDDLKDIANAARDDIRHAF